MTSSSTDMDTSGHPSSHPDPVLPKVEIIRSRLHINTPKHCFANVLTLAVPKGQGQLVTSTLMDAYSKGLHKDLPGKFLAKGMVNDNNKNFIE